MTSDGSPLAATTMWKSSASGWCCGAMRLCSYLQRRERIDLGATNQHKPTRLKKDPQRRAVIVHWCVLLCDEGRCMLPRILLLKLPPFNLNELRCAWTAPWPELKRRSGLARRLRTHRQRQSIPLQWADRPVGYPRRQCGHRHSGAVRLICGTQQLSSAPPTGGHSADGTTL